MTHVVLTIQATATDLPTNPVTNTVVYIELMDVNEAPRFPGYYPSPLLIGYPGRSYFDLALQNTIFQFKVETISKNPTV